MENIRESNGKFQVFITKDGSTIQSEVFRTLKKAQAWRDAVRKEIDAGEGVIMFPIKRGYGVWTIPEGVIEIVKK